MDIDVGKVPEASQLPPLSEQASIPTLDGWIENLMNCKQLAENDVTRLCDRVSSTLIKLQKLFEMNRSTDRPLKLRLAKFCKTSQMYNQW